MCINIFYYRVHSSTFNCLQLFLVLCTFLFFVCFLYIDKNNVFGVFSPEIWFSLLCSNWFKCYLPLSVLSQTVQFLISNILKWMMIKGPPNPVTFYKHMLKLGELIVLWNYSLVCRWNCLSRFVAKWVGLQTTAL